MPKEAEQVITLVDVEPQRSRQPGDDGLRGVGATRLFQPCVVVGRDPRLRRDLITAKTDGTTTPTTEHTDILGAKGLAASAEEIGQADAIDH